MARRSRCAQRRSNHSLRHRRRRSSHHRSAGRRRAESARREHRQLEARIRHRRRWRRHARYVGGGKAGTARRLERRCSARRARRYASPHQGDPNRPYRSQRISRSRHQDRVSVGLVRLRSNGQVVLSGPFVRRNCSHVERRLSLSNARDRRAASQPDLESMMNQRGIVVLIALVAMLALAYAGMALMRSVDAATAITGNVGLAQNATLGADAAIEHAVSALFERRAVGDFASDNVSESYYASRQPLEDRRGVPYTLQQLANYPSDARVADGGEGNTVRYVVERMCTAAGAATPD